MLYDISNFLTVYITFVTFLTESKVVNNVNQEKKGLANLC